jgi:hypothetical protein
MNTATMTREDTRIRTDVAALDLLRWDERDVAAACRHRRVGAARKRVDPAARAVRDDRSSPPTQSRPSG